LEKKERELEMWGVKSPSQKVMEKGKKMDAGFPNYGTSRTGPCGSNQDGEKEGGVSPTTRASRWVKVERKDSKVYRFCERESY